MADWNERAVTTLSWLFPVVGVAIGVLSYPGTAADPLTLTVSVT